MKAKILICGDIHGNFDHLNALIRAKEPDMVLQVGDFGYWPGKYWPEDAFDSPPIERVPLGVHFCDGNHEDFWRLRQRASDEVGPAVFYHPRGSTMRLPDGRTAMFFGGASSVDRGYRTLGIDWFPDEVATYSDFARASEYEGRVDVMISHTCPMVVKIRGEVIRENDPSREALEALRELYRPTLWYFGHWHQSVSGEAYGTYWECLNKVPDGGWWTFLR